MRLKRDGWLSWQRACLSRQALWVRIQTSNYPTKTDEDGLPIPAEKSNEDGRYHLYGDLQLAPPPSAFKNCLKQMEKVLAFVGGAKVLCLGMSCLSLPR
jgi:hypothetical protein